MAKKLSKPPAGNLLAAPRGDHAKGVPKSTTEREEADVVPYAVIPEEHCAAIGNVAIVWADFELAVDRAVWVLLGVDQQLGACVTAQLSSMFNRMNALAALAHERGASEAICKKLKKLAGDLGSLSEQRNRVVHDARFLGAASKTIYRFQATAKSTLKFDHFPEAVPELHAIAIEMNRKKREFVKLWQALSAELENLPPRRMTRPRMLVFEDIEGSPQNG